ncbi:Gfo/Idh/MocA family oxidoreductase [Dactylosporangium cerinum]
MRATDAEIVTIATPPDTHAELAGLAVAAGRHVICEKPSRCRSSRPRR